MTDISVTKRDGSLEKLDLGKIDKVLNWAASGLNNVSVSQVALRSKLQLHDGIRTEAIHKALIKTAADLISEANPDYQNMAANLALFQLRKKAFGNFEPPRLDVHVMKMVSRGLYDPEIMEHYSVEELVEMNDVIDHNRDFTLSYAAVKQLEGKYLLQDRGTDEIFESPQLLYAMVALCLFMREDKDKRMALAKEFYEYVSTYKISLPSPVMNGVRTNVRQFSSCVVIETDDSLDSINASTSAIVKYISQRAGIGINAGRIRALGSKIKKGYAVHTGVIPFYKMFQAAVKSCSQGGMRGGAATLFYPLWHLEAESLLVLKNNRGVEDNRVRHLDYGVQINRLLYTRLIKNQNITLFSPHETPGLYDAFFENQEEFERLYHQYEKDESIRKKSVSAVELFSSLMQERAGTGRIYIQNVDHCNTHSAFDPAKAPIRQSNLCMEITLPTKPLKHILDEEGEISLCTLGALNMGKFDDTNLDEMERPLAILVRALDNLLDYQDYPVPAAKTSTINRRSLGIGIINYAYYLAKHGTRYSDKSSLGLTHRFFEAFQYYLLKADIALAEEKGACNWFKDTTYAKGILPIDTYKKEVDGVCDEPLRYDWDTLRIELARCGLRNSTLSSLMPSETSSQISNATNGIEPPRGLITVKASKDGILKQVVPEIEKYSKQYELLWDMPNMEGYLQNVAVMQKFVDQAISANTAYDPSKFPGNKVPMKQLLKDLLTAYKLGVKTLYYHNTRDGADDRQGDMDGGCEGGACKI